jgi:DNA-binding transcriptional LysR family regulator
MELRHLRYFVTVAEEMSFTRASRKLHIAQPPLSRQIRKLEEDLGVTLLERTSRSMRLTNAGRLLMEEGRVLLSQAAGIVERCRRAGVPASECVRVGFATGLGDSLQAALMQHLASHPQAEVHYKNLLSSEHQAALREHQIDIGLLRPPVDDPSLEGEVLYPERLVALLPKHHPLARLRSITVQQLSQEIILLHKRSVSVGIYDKVVELIREAGIQPKLVQTRTGPYEEAGTLLVAAGKGIYIAGGYAVLHPGASREIRAVPLAGPNAMIGIWMAWRKGEQSPATLAFMQSMRLALKKSQDTLARQAQP